MTASCIACDGEGEQLARHPSGRTVFRRCAVCDGTGGAEACRDESEQRYPCPVCAGTGYHGYSREACPRCGGAGCDVQTSKEHDDAYHMKGTSP